MFLLEGKSVRLYSRVTAHLLPQVCLRTAYGIARKVLSPTVYQGENDLFAQAIAAQTRRLTDGSKWGRLHFHAQVGSFDRVEVDTSQLDKVLVRIRNRGKL